MKVTLTAKAGLVLVGLGLLIFLGFAIWAKSIQTTVLDIPMPMRTETVSQIFSVDYNAIYTMWVQFRPSLPPPTAHCLLGKRNSELDADLNCTKTAPLLKFSWTLSRDGQTGETGSSAETGSSLTEGGSLKVSIVSFPAQKKHRYTVTLNFDQDASPLKMPPPKVRIELDIFNREDFIFVGATFDSLALLLCLAGAMMFLVPFLKARSTQSKLPS